MEIHLPLVASLYRDTRTLILGAVATTLACLMTAWVARDPLLLACAFAIAAIALFRALDARAFARTQSSLADTQSIRFWENRYIAGASIYAAMMGIWVLAAFTRTDESLVHLLSFSMTLVNMIGVAGRNFGSKPLVVAQLLSAGVPMSLAVLLHGELYFVVFACVLLPFFVSFKSIADQLRRTLVDAAAATREVQLLADRFDTALNNMPHGLCMFDSSGQLAVFNRQLPDVLGVGPVMLQRGISISQLLDACVECGVVSQGAARRHGAEIARRIAGEAADELLIETQDERVLELTFQMMKQGGSVVLVEDVTERKSAEAKIQYLARYDELTGLLNRTSFREHVDRILASARPGTWSAILFMDLDSFKQVNDTLGHPIGDQLLRQVSARLTDVLGNAASVGRFGGDEFVILQSPVVSIDAVSDLAARIVDAIAQPYQIDGNQVVVGSSIGIATAPMDGGSCDHLLKNADIALYRAKSENRGGWRFFEPEMNEQAQARRRLELDLREAVANDAFTLHFQPIVDLRTRRASTCEALVRWPHPQRGMVSPAQFIPVAEEMGLIVEIGSQVLRKACVECSGWPDDVGVAVNLSPIQFRRGSVVAAVRDALAVSGLAPERLELEITESVLLQDTEATRACLEQLREIGIRISLDDFGTGYSSLSYLHSFPLDKVKIDQSFLHEIETSARSRRLLEGIARLSVDIGLAVVIEGVETERQFDLVAGVCGVSQAQGFLFSKPVSASAIRALLYAEPAGKQRVA